MKRIVEIKSHNSVFGSRIDSLIFNGDEKKDSEALHELLCSFDPGDEYTVSFKNVSN